MVLVIEIQLLLDGVKLFSKKAQTCNYTNFLEKRFIFLMEVKGYLLPERNLSSALNYNSLSLCNKHFKKTLHLKPQS